MKRNAILTLILCAMIGVLILFSSDAKQGAQEGVRLCEDIIIPSLLPILILTNIIIKSSCSKVFEAIFGRLFYRLYKLPKCASTAVILGLIGGYPAGAVLTGELFSKGKITKREAERIMHINFCGGGAFIITAVGTICYDSTKIGICIYGINLLSSIIVMGVESLFIKEKPEVNSLIENNLDFSNAVVEAVEATVKSILAMSAYIILFSAFANLIEVPVFITPIIEITNGVMNQERALPLPYCAMFLSFGGLCIHLQLIGLLNEMKIKYTDFLLFRLIGALLSFFITKVWLYFSPQSESVFSNLSSISPKLNQVNTGLSVIMILGCAVFVLDIERKKLLTNA